MLVQDIKDHYEQKWKRCEKLYEELHKALLEVEKKRRDLSKYGNVPLSLPVSVSVSATLAAFFRLRRGRASLINNYCYVCYVCTDGGVSLRALSSEHLAVSTQALLTTRCFKL